MSEDDKYRKTSNSYLLLRALFHNRLWETNWVYSCSRRSIILVLCCLCYYAAWGPVQVRQPSTAPENIKPDFQDFFDVGERRRRNPSGKVNRFDAPRLRDEEARSQKEALSRSEQVKSETEQQQAAADGATNKKYDTATEPSTLKEALASLNRAKVKQNPPDAFSKTPGGKPVPDDEMQFPMMPKQQKSPETKTPPESPPVQLASPAKEGSADPAGLEMVKNMMKHAWNSYVQFAWGTDELMPLSKRGRHWIIPKGYAATVIDSLDTLWIMGLTEEFEQAKKFVLDEVSFDLSGGVSVFETNIRVVGGLLAAFSLSGDHAFVKKAVEIADRLMPAFKTPTGVPNGVIDLQTGDSRLQTWSPGAILAEYGSMDLEFWYLSEVSEDPKYSDAVMKVMDFVTGLTKPIPGLYPTGLNNQLGSFYPESSYTVGALADSFYEYLLKMWVLSGESLEKFRTLYDESAEAIQRHLVRQSSHGDTYIGIGNTEYVSGDMEHLTCFAGGMFAFGAVTQKSELQRQNYFDLGAKLTETCYKMYSSQVHGLAAEKTSIETWTAATRYYIQRPEVVESIFYMWRFTHDQKYRDWGMEIAKAIERNCKVEAGYTGLQDMTATPLFRNDNQESFFLAETLKYLYLLFAEDSVVSLDEFVFNTEAHPFRIIDKKKRK